METILIITSAVFFSLSVLFLALFIDRRNKNIKLKENTKNDSNVITSLKNDLKIFKNTLSTNREGFYIEHVNLTDDDGGSKPYTVNVYIREIDRYKNDMSKIQLIKTEITSGYSPDQYSWVRSAVEKRFSSVKKTDDIEWLEIEEDLKEVRKEKLKEILKDIENE